MMRAFSIVVGAAIGIAAAGWLGGCNGSSVMQRDAAGTGGGNARGGGGRGGAGGAAGTSGRGGAGATGGIGGSGGTAGGAGTGGAAGAGGTAGSGGGDGGGSSGSGGAGGAAGGRGGNSGTGGSGGTTGGSGGAGGTGASGGTSGSGGTGGSGGSATGGRGGAGGTGGAAGTGGSGTCISGATGTHAVRLRWTGTSSGSTASVVYEANTLPDTTRWHVSAGSTSIGFTPVFVDTALASGGLDLEGDVFMDVEISTAGLTAINRVAIAVYGRSYNTTTSGSFTWQTIDGMGAAPTNLVSNVAPYKWYAADATTEFAPGETGALIRLRAGPSSNALAVNGVEICFDAR